MKTLLIDDQSYAVLAAVPALLAGVLGASAEIAEESDDSIRHDTPLEVQIAAACHEANRQYCRMLGDESIKPWSQCGGPMQATNIEGVRAIRDGLVTTPAESHEAWRAAKIDAGWVYGPEKSEVNKTHPNLVPYAELSIDQRRKDLIFFTLANALLSVE